MEPCGESIAAGDGRELWQYLSSGQIASVVGKKCISVGTGNTVMLKSCDASSSSLWEAQGSGTLYLYMYRIWNVSSLHVLVGRTVALWARLLEHERPCSWYKCRIESGSLSQQLCRYWCARCEHGCRWEFQYILGIFTSLALRIVAIVVDMLGERIGSCRACGVDC